MVVRVTVVRLAPPLRLSFIRALAGDGMLDLNMQALETVPVKVEPKTLEMTGLYSAPAGTAP
ncbi:MAG TPA: hypothetical protein VGN48_04075, partial [Pedococcus sp.]|nr:hypothetical protein [Pedococcus sp.]